MTSNFPGCCAFCGKNIPFKTVLMAPLTSGRRWNVTCPHCDHRNYMHILPDLFICLAVLLFSFSLVAKLAARSGIPNVEHDALIGFGAALLFYIPIRGAMNYAYLRIGKFHKTSL